MRGLNFKESNPKLTEVTQIFSNDCQTLGNFKEKLILITLLLTVSYSLQHKTPIVQYK